MKETNIFQTVLIIVFCFFLIVGTLMFAGVIPTPGRVPSGGVGGTVVMWGPVPSDRISSLIGQINDNYKTDFTLNYYHVPATQFESTLLNALARNEGPDLILASQGVIFSQADKILTIPFETYPLRQFQETYVQGGEIFRRPDGFLALPYYVDPLVLYYNRDLFTNPRLPEPPKSWSDFPGIIKELSDIDDRNNISRSAIAMGQFSNIAHAKDILVLLMMQAGNPIVVYESLGPRVTLEESGYAQSPVAEALGFFGRFSDPTNSLYSWNSARPEARDAFLRGNTAMYLGYASEYESLRRQNPQLRFDAVLTPQRQGATSLTLGNFSGLAILRQSRKPVAALQVAYALSSPSFARVFAEIVDLPPVRLDLVSRPPVADSIRPVFYQSALIARSWPDANPPATAKIFRDLFDAVRIGRVDVGGAIRQARSELERTLNIRSQ